ncbi:MAG: ABC-F family ATP-binding cassette domain-containing protein [Planctomycetota bacterium]|nr:ABC-F family ATP-binding cassette domain-containing protein [Planctomycetota bacterium]
MPVISLSNVHHAYGSQVVLDGVAASIEPGEKIGLVGRNGSGKTTLMRVMLGEISPDSGAVQLQRGAGVGYLRQDPAFDPNETVRDAAEGAFAHLHRLHQQLHDVYEKMTAASGVPLDRLLKRQAALDGQIKAAGGYAIDHKIDAALHGMGFMDEQFGLATAVLSGGQLSRLGLARLLLEEPDLLLLDEPTNHLDIDGRQWLEQFLAQEYRGAVLLVSHDRWLLDRVVGRIIEIERGSLRDYPGNYSKYVDLRRQHKLTEARTYAKQVEKIRREERFIARYKAGQRARQAKGRQSRLERFRRDKLIDRPSELDVMRLTLPKARRSGEQVIVAESISKRYGDTVLFEDLTLTIRRGDRVGIIGPNGVGKTTLVECLLGELEPQSGAVRTGSRLSVGYYRQRQEHLDLELPLWRYLQSVIVSLDGQARGSEQQARDLAGAFHFSGDEQDKLLGDLSGGERSRAVLAGIVAGAHNLLILDEPTNHLDIPSAEQLEQALSVGGGYAGTLLLITHDRALLEATCETLLIFDGRGEVRVFHGRYSHWAEQNRAIGHAVADRRSRSGLPAGATPLPRSRRPAAEAAAGVSLARLERRIEALQQGIGEVDQQMLDPAVYTDGARCKALKAQRAEFLKELEPLERTWARRAAEA